MSGRVRITLDGSAAKVAAGTSVAAALLASGRTIFRRSVTGEARAPLCGMGVCFECRVRLDERHHVRSCMHAVAEGMRVDTAACAGGPEGRWRPEAVTPAPVPGRVDVLVVGAGPAGLAAAVAAAEAGAAVLVVDDNAEPGGQIWRRARGGTPVPAAARLRTRAQEAGVRWLAGAALIDGEAAAGGVRALLAGRDQAAAVAARSLVLACGARELWVPFPGWTLPGVVGAGGLQALVKQGLPVAGSRVVVAGSGPLLVAVAASLRMHGARVSLVAEQAPALRAASFLLAGGVTGLGRLAQAAQLLWRLRGTPLRHGWWPVRAEGSERLEAVVLATPRGPRRIACDWLACGFGLVPQTEAARLLGCALEGDAVRVDADQRTSVPAVFAAGEVCGIGGVEVALAEGFVAGRAAAGRPIPRAWRARRERARRLRARLRRAYALRPQLRGLPAPDTIVCRCEDVTFAQLAGFATAREAKLTTRCGMGPCQGRVCGPATRFLFGWRRDRVRPPLIPVPVAALAYAAAAGSTDGEDR